MTEPKICNDQNFEPKIYAQNDMCQPGQLISDTVVAKPMTAKALDRIPW